MLTPHGHTFSIDARGQKWRGTWETGDGEVCVNSAFGSERRKIGRRKPDAVAKEIMVELVNAWAERRKS